jgi:hypothetical protein
MYPNQNIEQAPQNNPELPARKSSPKLLLLVIVGVLSLIIGLAGGFLGASSSKNSELNSKISSLQSENEKLKKELDVLSVNTDDTVSHFSYLNIPEWKIRMPLNDKYTDVVYRIKSELGSSYVEITSATLAKISTCVNYEGQIGTITKAKAGEVPEPTKHVTGFDGQIYMFKPFEQTCTSNPTGIEAPYKASILEQFAKLEPLPVKRVTAE